MTTKKKRKSNAGRKELPPERKREKRKELRFTNKEWEMIEERAAANQKEVAVFLRELLIETLVRMSRS